MSFFQGDIFLAKPAKNCSNSRSNFTLALWLFHTSQIIWIYTFKLTKTQRCIQRFFFKLEHACMTCAIVFLIRLTGTPKFQAVLHNKLSPVLTFKNPRRVAFVKEEKASNMPIYKQIMIHDEYSFCQMGSSVFTVSLFVTLNLSFCDCFTI